MKDTVFYFNFVNYTNPNRPEDNYKGFIIKDFNYDLVKYEDDSFLDHWDMILGKYDAGWITYPAEEVNGIAFLAKVRENKIDEIMRKWQQYFIDNGATVSRVVDIPLTPHGNLETSDVYLKNDYGVYQLVKEQL